MKLLLAINGTGPYSDTEYASVMEKSFVRQMYKNWRGGPAAYIRGPAALGMTSADIGETMLKVFHKYMDALYNSRGDTNIEIYLTGYSRGALIATYIANRIHEFNILHRFGQKTKNSIKSAFGFKEGQIINVKIKSMILFDSVDRAIGIWGHYADTIPPIVESVHHYVRSGIGLDGEKRISREYFSGVELEFSSNSTKRSVIGYACTHSALGGLPGDGDHFKPGPSGSQVMMQSLKERSTATKIASVINPVVGGVVTASALWEGGKAGVDRLTTSDITLQQDWAGYRAIHDQLVKALFSDGWNTRVDKRFPAFNA